MYNILRLFACDCTACPFKCDGTEAKWRREALVRQMQFEETLGLILLAVIAILIIVVIVLVIRLIFLKKSRANDPRTTKKVPVNPTKKS